LLEIGKKYSSTLRSDRRLGNRINTGIHIQGSRLYGIEGKYSEERERERERDVRAGVMAADPRANIKARLITSLFSTRGEDGQRKILYGRVC
jgi:hypothetical protein